ncbi:prolyl oligopeptidase family serine peptidase [Sphingomonas sp. Tas61C01]|uniref:prolyl oligopeptidase family serine peptidase n=1 Tax=Sphingomonas sp. Tas61C01 TaxID=3458297 RepID=UPI00403E705E
MGKWLIAATLCLPAAVMAQSGTTNGLTDFPEIPKAEPFREQVFDVAIDDPYRWMEKADRRADLETWVNASSLHTTTELAALPGRQGLLKEMEALSRANSRYFSAQEAGGKLFFEMLAPDKQVAVLMVRDGGKDRVLLDPMAGTDGKTPRAISSYSVSPDGRFAAIHVGEGGGETGAIRIYDVATGRPTADTLTPVWGEFRVGWIDDATVIYTRLASTAAGADQMKGMVAFLHRMGTSIDQDVAVLGGTGPDHGFRVDPTQFPIVLPDPTSPWVLAYAANARAEIPLAVGRLSDLRAGRPAWIKLADYDDRINSGDIVGDTLYYLTSKTDENGELRAIDLADGTPSLNRSRVVMRSENRVLTSIAATDSGLYVTTTLPSAAAELWFLPKVGGTPRKLALPASQSIDDMAVTPDRRSVTFSMGGYTSTDVYYRATAGQVVPVGLANTAPPSAARRTVVQETATSRDGTRVPLTIVYSGARKGPGPTVIEAYGSYGVSGQPYYSPGWDIWNQRGGTYAYCHIRGGGELGEAWHRGGMQANKVNSHADLTACAERLIKLGYATPRTLGIFGASAAGLLVPPTAIKRPDLFAAVVTRVGIVNPIRLGAANNGPNQYGEMGDPQTRDGFAALAAQDSTLLLPKASGGTDYLFTVGLNDKRVDPWMSAKLAALMRAKWGDRHLVLIRSDGKAGHGIGSTRDQGLEERADIFAFFLNRFGAPGFVK